ncbi:kinase-like domain-containing protein, partial [Mycena leptocephala]
LLQIIQGIHYLHSNSIIHGDIRGTNILIAPSLNNSNSTPSFSSTPDVHACLTDFGLATVITGDGDTDTGIPSSSNRAGSLRWFAPELLSPQEFWLTRATDVYTFACVCVE